MMVSASWWWAVLADDGQC